MWRQQQIHYNIGKLSGDIGANSWVLAPSFGEFTPIITPGERATQTGDAFEDTAFETGFVIFNSKWGCRVSALHFFCDIDATKGFLKRVHSSKCFFQLLILGLTPVSLLESELGFDIATQLADAGKWPFSHLESMMESRWSEWMN